MLQVTDELKTKQKIAAHEKADTVRADGHGVYPNSSAVVTSRSMTVESNKELGAQMRHEYMEQVCREDACVASLLPYGCCLCSALPPRCVLARVLCAS